MTTSRIYQKIDLYFDAGLSAQEESSLLKELLGMQGVDPRIDEALAVMLAARVVPCVPVRKRHPLRKAVAAAAVVTAVLVAGHVFLHHSGQQDAGMVAYVAGEKVKDPEEIKNIIAIQLSDIGESTDLLAQTVSDDFDDLREALISDDI